MSVYLHCSAGGETPYDALIEFNNRLAKALSNVSIWRGSDGDRMGVVDRIFDEVIADKFIGELDPDIANDNA